VLVDRAVDLRGQVVVRRGGGDHLVNVEVIWRAVQLVVLVLRGGAVVAVVLVRAGVQLEVLVLLLLLGGQIIRAPHDELVEGDSRERRPRRRRTKVGTRGRSSRGWRRHHRGGGGGGRRTRHASAVSPSRGHLSVVWRPRSATTWLSNASLRRALCRPAR